MNLWIIINLLNVLRLAIRVNLRRFQEWASLNNKCFWTTKLDLKSSNTRFENNCILRHHVRYIYAYLYVQLHSLIYRQSHNRRFLFL